MQLTNRQKNILLFLNDFETEVPGKLISENLHISLRTIQSEVKAINKDNKLTIIESNNRGYTLNRNELKNFSLLSIPSVDNFSPILKLLILENRAMNIDDLADRLYLSPAALQQRLKKLDAKLENYNLKLTRDKNQIGIIGTEYHKRQLIHDMIVKEINLNFDNIENASNYFSNLNIQRVQDIIMTTIHKYDYYVEPFYSQNLIINILIALSRIRENFFIENQNNYVNKDMVEYKIAKEICNQLDNNWYSSITENDIQYIAMLIMGQIKAKINRSADSEEEKKKSSEILQIIRNTFDYYMLNLNYNSFLSNFIKHINALLIRARNKQFAVNLISENLKEMSPFIYDVAVHLSQSLEKHFNVNITDEEIGLLSVYIGFIIEQSITNDDLVHVLIICNEYHYITDHILTKLKSNYENKIEIVNVLNSLTPAANLKNVDLIIHTIPIHVLGKKSVLISPFYTDTDNVNINDAINQITVQKKKKHNLNLLLTYFNEKLYFKNLGIKNKTDAIKFLGHQAEKINLCEKGFTESVLKREEISSTCFLKMFAVPHAIELNAKFTQFCVLIEEDGIQWDDNIIHCVFMIAVSKKDRKAFMKIYSGIVQILCDKESIDKLVSAPDFKTFINCFNQ